MQTPRRLVLQGAAALAGAALLPRAAAAANAARLRLRLLATSDLHMFATGFDYFHDREDATTGLSHVASLIAAARAEEANTLLFDNGDIIQGNPLGDFVARPGGLAAGLGHPMFRAMNRLGYDAATVGNHEFNYGLDFLEVSLSWARFPVVCANLRRADGREFLPPSMVLTRRLRAEDGSEHVLRIGVIGLVTPQIMLWDRANLEGRLVAGDIVDTAAALVPSLRANCDIVVALSHSGISGGARARMQENASFHLAAVPGIDAIITGHSHRVFPGPDYAGLAGIDAVAGRLVGVPAVMPGFWGSHLGLIDLVLERGAAGWRVADATAEARPIYRRDGARVVSLVAEVAAINQAVAPEHAATREWVAAPVGRIDDQLDSYFALVGDDAVVSLINQAQTGYMRDLLAGTAHAALPLLSAAAPFKSGGMAADDYVAIPAGPIAIRDLAEIYLYPNTLVALRVSGAMLAEWLERSAAIFRRIDPALDTKQDLLEPHMPGYNFDVISGLTWRIDLAQPARYGGRGQLLDAAARRITDLRHDGRPLDPAAEFIIVTNNYRADGGGGFPGLGDASRIVLRAPDTARDVLVRDVAARGAVHVAHGAAWRLAAAGRRTTLTFTSSPAARAVLERSPGLAWLGEDAAGFGRFTLTLPAD